MEKHRKALKLGPILLLTPYMYSRADKTINITQNQSPTELKLHATVQTVVVVPGHGEGSYVAFKDARKSYN